MTTVTPDTFPEEYTQKSLLDAKNLALLNGVLDVNKETKFEGTPFPMDTWKTLTAGALSLIPFAGGALSLVVDTVWTNIMETNQNGQEFSLFKEKIEAIVSEKIVSYDYEALKQMLKATVELLNYLRDALKDLSATPKNIKLREQVRLKLMSLETSYVNGISAASKDTYRVEELPLYTMFANGYLVLLRDIVLSKGKWGFDDATLLTYKERFYQKKTEFSNYCVETYKLGVAKIYLKAPKKDIITFNKLLVFRSLMNYFVFDYVHLWEAMDFEKYPQGCSFENTRYLYTNVVGLPVRTTTQMSGAYYLKSFDEMVSEWKAKNVELYKKDLKLVAWFRESANKNFYIGFNPQFTDDAAVNGVRVGSYIGSPQGTESSWISDFSKGVEESVTVSGDLLPRFISFSVAQNAHALKWPYSYSSPMHDALNTDWYFHTRYPTDKATYYQWTFPGQSQDTSTYYAPSSSYSDVDRYKNEYPVYKFGQHKIGNVWGFGINSDPHLSAINKRTDGLEGYLDSCVVGLSPVNQCRYNIVSKTGVTIISSQKFFTRAATTSFEYDFVNNPKFWESTFELAKTETISYSADCPDDSKSALFYIGLKYNSNANIILTVRDVNSNTQIGTIAIVAGNSVETYSTFSVNLANYKFGRHRYDFKFDKSSTDNDKLNIISVLFKPFVV